MRSRLTRPSVSDCARLVVLLAVVALLGGSGRPAGAAAGVRGTYVGTIGPDAVVVQVGTADDGAGDRYFRRGDGHDIPLDLTARGSVVTAEEHAPGAAFALRARLRLAAAGDRLRGTYTLVRTGTALPVALRRATAADAPAPGPASPLLTSWRRSDLYTALKLDRPLVRVRVARLAGRTVTWLREPRSGVVFPRLPGAGRLNDALADEHVRRVRDALSCPIADGWDASVHISLLTRRVLSLRGYVFASCGGAHPDGFPTPATFDAQRGVPVVLEDLYRVVPLPAGLDPASPPAYDTPAGDRWSAYLDRRGRALRRLALAARPKVMAGPCWGSALAGGLEWQFVTWHLSRSGLVLQGDFPHVADVCDPVTITVPYALVHRYRVASGPAPA